MDSRKKVSPSFTRAGRARRLVVAAGMALIYSSAGWAQQPAPIQLSTDPSDIASGFSLFRTKADCQACHGWAADGRKIDNQAPDGANLRETKLTADQVAMTVKCGRPGTGMPAFDKFAYSDGRCFGMKQADLDAAGQTLGDPPATLTAREINLVVDFLFAKVVNQGPMDHAKCVAYWGSNTEPCQTEFPN